MIYNRCGRSGLLLPAISLGMWHNFGSVNDYQNARKIIYHAFDQGVTHFDLANNYGPEPGSAEETLGRVLKEGFASHRDEILISTKAGYEMWQGPYGDGGSRKYLISSLDQSLKRLNVDYVDIFYHHRPDPLTPIEETMTALDHIVRSGKALYIGISNYQPADAQRAFEVLKSLGTPCLIHQAKYNMFDRWVEKGLLQLANAEGVGVIAFSPLAQGLLTNRYLNGIPDGSRMTHSQFLRPSDLTDSRLQQITALNDIAAQRGQALSQMALAWLLRSKSVTSVLVGASSCEQLDANLQMFENMAFSPDELAAIEAVLSE